MTRPGESETTAARANPEPRPRSLDTGDHGVVVLVILVAGGLSLSLAVSGLVQREYTHASAKADRRECRDAIRAVTDEVSGLERDVVALQSLYLASARVEPVEFTTFARNLRASSPTRLFEWAPRVLPPERAAFEAGLDNSTGAPIVERQGDVLVRAADRDDWFPILYAEPPDILAQLRGFDLGQDPVRRSPIEGAWSTGGVTHSGPISLVQQGVGFLTIAPVYRGTHATMVERDQAFAGVVVAVARVDDLLADALHDLPDGHLQLSLVDTSAAEPLRLMGSFPKLAPAAAEPPVGALVDVAELNLGPTPWELRCALLRPRPAKLGISAVTTFAAGFAITVLVAGYVRLLGIRAAEADAHAARLSKEIAERRNAEAVAGDAETKFKIVAEEAGVGVYLLQDGRIRYANPRLAAFFGRTVSEVVDHLGPTDLHPQNPDIFAEPSNRGATGRRELHLRGERERVLELYTTEVVMGGRPAILGTVVDVTERREVEAAQNRVERLESLGLLAGGIAHDFNNLLTAIMGNLGLAELAVEPDSAAAGRIEDAIRAVNRATGLTTQLRTFSRGGAPILAPTDLRAVLRDTATFALRGSPVACELQVAEDLWPIEADANQLSQVIHNLVLNASQAMPQGGRIVVRAGNVTLSGHPVLGSGRFVEFGVVDEGTGMSPEVREHIFDPYFTTRRTGTGLGLASAFSIVRRHGGTLTVESQLGRGSTFTVRLPANAVEDLRPPSDPPPSRAATGRVLVMDDDDAVRAVAVGLLASLGYQPEETRDGAEAVALYERRRAEGRRFDVVVLDLTVPGAMGGREAMALLRALDPDVRCIASSGYSEESIVVDLANGFAGVLPKPYRRAELRAVMASVIRGD